MSEKSFHKDTRKYFEEKYSRNQPAFLKKLDERHQAPVHDEDETEVVEK